MKKVIIDQQDSDTIDIFDISDSKPIFAKIDGKLVGMLVEEDDGWILRIGGRGDCSGYSKKRADCIRKALSFRNYTFHIE